MVKRSRQTKRNQHKQFLDILAHGIREDIMDDDSFLQDYRPWIKGVTSDIEGMSEQDITHFVNLHL